MQEKFQALTNEWVALSSLITVDSSADYRIQNRGADVLVALESTGAPSEDNEDGTLIPPLAQAFYKKGDQDLYLRAFNRSCSINITKVG